MKFAPKHLGLLLASCSADGVIRIYEAPDIMNLSQWTVQHDINTKMACSCLAWNPSPFHPPMIAVGSDDTGSGSKMQIYESSENTRRWIKVESVATISDPVHDVSFAPNIGRSYHLIAVGMSTADLVSFIALTKPTFPLAASKDVRILSLKSTQQDMLSMSQSSQPSAVTPKYEIRQVAQFDDHSSQVWRVSWNITGTILASSGDDGNIRLWKCKSLNCAAAI